MLLKWNAGTENAFLNYSKAFNELNYNTINLIHQKAQIIPILQQNNLKYIKSFLTGRLGKFDIFTLIYFWFLIKKYKINIVFAHNGRAITLFKKLKNKNLKIISVNHGHNPKHGVGSDLSINLNSHNLKETIKLGQPEDKAIIVPNCIEIPINFHFLKEKQDIFTIGSYGRFSSEKGYKSLVECCKILKSKNFQFKCIIGGDGEEKSEIESLISKYNLKNEVELVGWVKNKEYFFKNLDLFILPSLKEEFGLVILESMLYKTPVLATKCFGPNDIIEDGVNGFLTEINNHEAMAKKIMLIRDLDLSKIVTNSNESLQNKFLYNRFLELIVETIRM